LNPSIIANSFGDDPEMLTLQKKVAQSPVPAHPQVPELKAQKNF